VRLIGRYVTLTNFVKTECSLYFTAAFSRKKHSAWTSSDLVFAKKCDLWMLIHSLLRELKEVLFGQHLLYSDLNFCRISFASAEYGLLSMRTYSTCRVAVFFLLSLHCMFSVYSEAVRAALYYTLCSEKKHPLTFSFISPWIICGFKQKLQWICPSIDRF